MNLAKTEKIKFDFNNKLFNLIYAMERSFDNMEFLAKEKNISLILKIDKKLFPFLRNLIGDEGRYTQILLNFLSNSLNKDR